MTNPIVPDVFPPMTRPGRLGSLVTVSICCGWPVAANVAPVSSSIRDWS